MGKKLRKIDRDIDIAWKKLGIGYNEDRRDVWVEIHDDLGFIYKLRLTKKQARGIANQLFDCIETLDSRRDNKI